MLALGHDGKAVRSRYESSRAPCPRDARSRKLWVCENITNSGKGFHVEVATDEVDVVRSHVCVQSSEKVSGGIAFLDHNIVKVNRAKRDRGRTTRTTVLHVSLLVEASRKAKAAALGSNVSLLSAGEIDESASDVGVYGMVRWRLPSTRCGEQRSRPADGDGVSLGEKAGYMEWSMRVSPSNKVSTDLRNSTFMSRTHFLEIEVCEGNVLSGTSREGCRHFRGGWT